MMDIKTIFRTIKTVLKREGIGEYGGEQSDSGHCATDYIRINYGVRVLTYIGNSNARHAFYDKDILELHIHKPHTNLFSTNNCIINVRLL